MLDGITDQVGCAGEVELFHNPAAIGRGGAGRDVHLLRNFLEALPTT